MRKNSAKAMLTIGQLARRHGLNVRTLRYYESIGLLPVAERTESGYRLYSEADEHLLQFVLQAKAVGFSLDEIQEIVRLGRHSSACCYVRETLACHITAIETQIAQLQAMRVQLESASSAWRKLKADDGEFCGLIEAWPGSFQTQGDEKIMADKRLVEVFIAGCPLCDEAVKLVNLVACSNCEVKVYDLREGCATNECRDLAQRYGVKQVPAVVVNGQTADCCRAGGVNEASLRAAGVGAA